MFIEHDRESGNLIVHSDHDVSAVTSTTSTGTVLSGTFGFRTYTTFEMHPHTHEEFVAVEIHSTPQFSDGRHTVEMTPLDVVGFGTAALVPVAWRSLKRRARTS